MAKILVVEDDPGILLGLVRNLEFEGYEVTSTQSGAEGLRLALEGLPDLILLDIMLPECSGYEICKLVRREGLATPILFLSARGAERDKVEGLHLGGDDYITKPFGIQELLARVKAALRRARIRGGTHAPYQFGPYRVDFEQRRLQREGLEIEITDREFTLLAYLIGNAERALDRDKILREVWGYGYDGTARTIDNFITRLRKKLEVDPTRPRVIVTVRGHGYRFCPGGCA
ncbi:MAG: response regulator transcription factor [Planctomycetota bacterium]